MNHYFLAEGKDEHRKGLLHMKMAEGAKLQMCYLLQHLNDIQLRHRVEAIIAFAHDFVGDLQTDQLRYLYIFLILLSLFNMFSLHFIFCLYTHILECGSGMR